MTRAEAIEAIKSLDSSRRYSKDSDIRTMYYREMEDIAEEAGIKISISYDKPVVILN